MINKSNTLMKEKKSMSLWSDLYYYTIIFLKFNHFILSFILLHKLIL